MREETIVYVVVETYSDMCLDDGLGDDVDVFDTEEEAKSFAVKRYSGGGHYMILSANRHHSVNEVRKALGKG
jgi:hypothetical protein